jgi:hypothetical protein
MAATSKTKKDAAAKKKSPKPSRGRNGAVRRKSARVAAKVRDNARTAVTVGLAGLAAYLVSVVASIPVARLLEPLIAEIDTLYPFWRAITAAVVLDMGKGVALFAFGYPFGRFISTNPWGAAAGLTLTVYGSDMALSYVVGSFPIAWGHKNALLSRIPIALAFMAVTVALVILGHRHARRPRSKPGRKEKPGRAEGTAGEPGEGADDRNERNERGDDRPSKKSDEPADDRPGEKSDEPADDRPGEKSDEPADDRPSKKSDEPADDRPGEKSDGRGEQQAAERGERQQPEVGSAKGEGEGKGKGEGEGEAKPKDESTGQV